ncbi:hypothetical protein EB796_004159 [Bugula neritina]|uniref:B box-type domain-containing protein n=1 Tax=Bugula neritina TaxID=10212 RepID=A0A7J7KH42_BUGNE|nr:hypothetical protein EB796_004159 [Bugula neritina]
MPALISTTAFREVFDLKINSLPSSTTREDSALCCDTCIRKEEPNQLAVVYCKTCTAKFCAKHKESHDDLMGVHPMINMTEYKTQTIKLEPRLCSEHTTLPYSLGCRSCLIVACTKCVGALDNCTTGIVQLCPMKKTNATILSFILRAKVTSVRNFKHRKNQIASPPRCN